MSKGHRSLGGYIGTSRTGKQGGVFGLKQQFLLSLTNDWVTSYVKTGLVLDLDAGNNLSYPGSGSTWFDISGNNYHATLVNSPTYSSLVGGAIQFNGASAQTASVVKPNPNITGQISVEWWMNVSDWRSTSPVFIHKGGHYTTQFNPSSNTYQWADSSNYSYANYGSRSANINTLNTWIQYVITKDSSNNVRLYRNATLLDTRTSFGSPLTEVNTTLWLWGYSDTDSTPPSSSMATGRVSSVKVYNRQLSDAEVTQNFNALRGRHGI
jgi:hypothetical protein